MDLDLLDNKNFVLIYNIYYNTIMSGIFSCIPKNDLNFAINIEDLSNSICNKKK